MRQSRPLTGIWFAAVAFAACKSEPTPPPAPVPTTVTLSSTGLSFSALGATQQLTATVRDQNGQTMSGVTVTWATLDPAVASVTASGLVGAEGNGSTTVTATAGSVSAQATVAVAQVPAQVARIGGDAQIGQVGTQLPIAIEVEVRDSRGNPVPGGRPNTTVQFVAGQGGAAAPDLVMANASGRATTTWTLGTGSGAHSLTASVTTSVATQFSATATAGPPDALVKVSGDNQTGPNSIALPDSLVVRVVDQFGNPVGGHVVAFAATAGGGSVNPEMGATGPDGRAATAWTLGASLGGQTATATAAAAITGSPATFDATATNLLLAAVSPDTIVENASATLTGTGFDPTPANNTVTIDGAAATVTMASPTSLTVTVPAFDCRPGRGVDVQVTVGGANSNTLSHPLKPADQVNLAVGQQQIILTPATFCLQFAASAASEAYLIGVQSLSETPSNLTATRLIGATGFASPAPPALLPATAFLSSQQPVAPSDRDRRWTEHREAERRVRQADAMVVRSRPVTALASRSTAAPAVIIPGTVNVGDTVKNVRVWDQASNCTGYDSIAVVVRSKGTRGIWVEDVNNPASGYSTADFDSLRNYLDNIIFDTDTSYFGNPGDIDANSRIAIVVTKEVNRRGSLLGFVGSCDFYSRAQAPSSNEGEFFYAKAPDPAGAFGSAYTRNDAFADAPILIAHEFTHIIQFGRRLPVNGAAFTSWLMEGQATFAEEVNGFAVTGRMPGQNYGLAVAFNSPPSTDLDWHVDGFTDLALYYGFLTSTTRATTAPHECTWIGRQSEGNNGPCIPGREVYGVPYSLYRWAADQFGPGFAGNERGLLKAITGNPLGGYANLAAVTGVAIDTLLAQWAAMLYVDDRVPGAAARLTLPSWNLVNIESGLFATARLTPTEIGFAVQDLARNVRAGSTAYFRISGTSRPATAVRARSSTDTALPAIMNLWIVRLQ